MTVSKYIPILQYTGIFLNDKGDTHFCTTIEKFSKDMNMLINEGYKSVSLYDVYLHNQGIVQLPQKSFCMVFKGGYEDDYLLAFPILKHLSIKVSIFVATDLIGVSEYPSVKNYAPHFGWEQAQEMIVSKLVSIYPLWHPFDSNRDLNSESRNKISLLNDNLSENDSSFAFFYNNCNISSLTLLKDNGIKINITDFFHTNLLLIENGSLPSIYVEHTANIFDVIDQYDSWLQDIIEKDERVLQENAIYNEPNDESVSSSVQLPIDLKPMARNYLRHAFPLSIIQTERKDKAERLILRDYIEVIYKPWCKLFDYHNYHYEHWEFLDYRRISRDILDENKINIVEYIINGLKAGYYCDAWLDTYYIPGKYGYGYKHMSHGILIYGYDCITRSFMAVSYTKKGQYQGMIIPIKSVSLACTNKYFDYINLIKNNNRSLIEYNIHIIRDRLNSYINSVFFDDNMRYNKISSEQFYNYNACIEFAKDVKNQAEKDGHIDSIAMYGYTEHKRLMMWRLQYINEYEGLKIEGLKELTEKCICDAKCLLNVAIKFNMTQSESSINSVISIIDELNHYEKRLIRVVVNSIDRKYKK